MKTNIEKVKVYNDKQFLIDLRKAHKVWINAPQTGALFYISKKEVMDTATWKKVIYTMSTISEKLFMRIQ